ncbi:hypothetical protein BCR44DRAFT_1429175 [Catenaria anguillulae PL171]|uniref:Uncharacterized protein n=1 Tax=Catenaria anguillulae PL171 TaxID=765915 RepID=A0A1Y2HUV3_9FUNG|nr:hypothetical protein BCR44DRAFT_1429175 [Catenaria anguillulae PL171]
MRRQRREFARARRGRRSRRLIAHRPIRPWGWPLSLGLGTIHIHRVVAAIVLQSRLVLDGCRFWLVGLDQLEPATPLVPPGRQVLVPHLEQVVGGRHVFGIHGHKLLCCQLAHLGHGPRLVRGGIGGRKQLEPDFLARVRIVSAIPVIVVLRGPCVPDEEQRAVGQSHVSQVGGFTEFGRVGRE